MVHLCSCPLPLTLCPKDFSFPSFILLLPQNFATNPLLHMHTFSLAMSRSETAVTDPKSQGQTWIAQFACAGHLR